MTHNDDDTAAAAVVVACIVVVVVVVVVVAVVYSEYVVVVAAAAEPYEGKQRHHTGDGDGDADVMTSDYNNVAAAAVDIGCEMMVTANVVVHLQQFITTTL